VPVFLPPAPTAGTVPLVMPTALIRPVAEPTQPLPSPLLVSPSPPQARRPAGPADGTSVIAAPFRRWRAPLRVAGVVALAALGIVLGASIRAMGRESSAPTPAAVKR
jgi:hypothetical protein